MYQILRNCQFLNDLGVRIYDLGTLTTWLQNELFDGASVLCIAHKYLIIKNIIR